MSRVAVVKCEDYNEEKTLAALTRALELLGGMESFVQAGERILLKPNLLAPALPEKSVTTHPAVFKAAALLAKEAAAVLSYGDSPGFYSMEAAAKKCGIQEAASELGIAPGDFSEGREVGYANGRQNKAFTIANAVLESDGLISICKLKTHGFQKYTGAVKNQFGCIPGLLKGEFHVKIPDAENFARMLLDLNGCIKPRLYIMDAIMAMEGNGPHGGKPVNLGVMLVSDDPIALDRVACGIINIEPGLVPTVRLGEEMGYGTANMADIELLGDSIDFFTDKSFDIDRTPLLPGKDKWYVKLIGRRLLAKPVIYKNRCLKCGKCIQVCPVKPKAVDWPQKKRELRIPVYDYKRCIRCYCCQELCPEDSIKLQKPLVRKLLGRFM